jgi:hypothetical protein
MNARSVLSHFLGVFKRFVLNSEQKVYEGIPPGIRPVSKGSGRI